MDPNRTESPFAGALAGKVALVTGGSRGIGRAIAQALAAAGAAVAVTARTRADLDETVALIEAERGTALALAVDVTDRTGVGRVVEEVETRLGPTDVLVNDAARFQALGPVWEVDPDDWWREVEVNLRGPLLTTRAVLPRMLARGGRIVNIVSGAATTTQPAASAYSAGKTALLRFTDTLAREVDGTAVSVFAVDPGTIRTPMNEAVLRTHAGLLEQWAPWFIPLFAEHREDSVEPAVRLVTLLASGAADALSGRFLTARDDLAALLARADAIREEDALTLRLRSLSALSDARGPVPPGRTDAHG